jgi:glycosyltransferase 2 family protein
MKIQLKPIVKISLSLCFLILVFTQIDLSQVLLRLKNLSLPFIVFALLYYTGCQWMSCVRWHVVLRATGHIVPIRKLLSSYFAGMFVSVFMPGSFGGDVYRVYRVSKQIQDSEVALASVFLERFSGIASVFALALIGLIPAFQIMGSWDIVFLFMVCGGVISASFFLIASPKLLMWVEPWLDRFKLGNFAERILKFQVILRKFIRHRQSMMFAIGISVIIQLAIIYYQYLLAQQLEIPISYLQLLVFTPISIVVILLPISVGGLGLQEGLWAYLFTRIGLTADQAVTLSLTFTMLGWILSLPGALVLLSDSAGLRRLKHISKES